MVISLIVLLVRVEADWPQVFLGYIPSDRLFENKPNVVYTGKRFLCVCVIRIFLTGHGAVGILGATVMPHALFLGSYLSTRDRVSTSPPPIPSPVGMADARVGLIGRLRWQLRSLFTVSRAERVAAQRDHRNKYTAPENNTIDFVRAHLMHSVVDVVFSLLCVAVSINSMCVYQLAIHI